MQVASSRTFNAKIIIEILDTINIDKDKDYIYVSGLITEERELLFELLKERKLSETKLIIGNEYAPNYISIYSEDTKDTIDSLFKKVS